MSPIYLIYTDVQAQILYYDINWNVTSILQDKGALNFMSVNESNLRNPSVFMKESFV